LPAPSCHGRRATPEQRARQGVTLALATPLLAALDKLPRSWPPRTRCSESQQFEAA
jgi:hypothetical protein